ncbi:hypothetical protein [Saccharomonospora iraqiensis]|uniref:hypothetical protein n=1 Tax=Saccharomonospora iraqiensis TaxID=52698 RepID=UPI0004271846|nr:hypothetical protein [Saccharomonospora iraqiensis]
MPDIIAAIDEALGCHECGGPLEGSVDHDFCSERCHRAWHGRRVGVTPETSLDELVHDIRVQLGAEHVEVPAERREEIGRALDEARRHLPDDVVSTLRSIMETALRVDAAIGDHEQRRQHSSH